MAPLSQMDVIFVHSGDYFKLQTKKWQKNFSTTDFLLSFQCDVFFTVIYMEVNLFLVPDKNKNKKKTNS